MGFVGPADFRNTGISRGDASLRFYNEPFVMEPISMNLGVLAKAAVPLIPALTIDAATAQEGLDILEACA